MQQQVLCVHEDWTSQLAQLPTLSCVEIGRPSCLSKLLPGGSEMLSHLMGSGGACSYLPKSLAGVSGPEIDEPL